MSAHARAAARAARRPAIRWDRVGRVFLLAVFLLLTLAGLRRFVWPALAARESIIDLALQVERRLMTNDLVNSPVRFSVAGYFQYMVSPGLIQIDSGNLAPGTNINLGRSAAVALAPSGPIWIAEAKVIFKMKGSGVEMPFAITRASRTDLINSTVTRGQARFVSFNRSGNTR